MSGFATTIEDTMTTNTTTTRRASKPIAPASDAPAQPAPPPRPAIYLQIVLPDGASQPVGISPEAPDWEKALDDTVTQIKLITYRWRDAQMRNGQK